MGEGDDVGGSWLPGAVVSDFFVLSARNRAEFWDIMDCFAESDKTLAKVGGPYADPEGGVVGATLGHYVANDAHVCAIIVVRVKNAEMGKTGGFEAVPLVIVVGDLFWVDWIPNFFREHDMCKM